MAAVTMTTYRDLLDLHNIAELPGYVGNTLLTKIEKENLPGI
jgi:hypothetical protein